MLRPDLRDPSVEEPPYPSPWSQWNKRAVIELACRDAFEFFRAGLEGYGRALEVGCGTGWLALELAREGHEVVGVDPKAQDVALARRTAEAGLPLRYLSCRFDELPISGERYDAVIFNRSLHHLDLAELEDAVARSASLLRRGGVLLANEFAIDGIDARWLAWLGEPVSGRVREWKRDHSDFLTLEPMRAALRGRFEEKAFLKVPYLFVARANALAGDEISDVRPIKEEEMRRLADDGWPAVGFRWTGHRR